MYLRRWLRRSFVLWSFLFLALSPATGDPSHCNTLPSLLRARNFFEFLEAQRANDPVFRELVDSQRLPQGALNDLSATREKLLAFAKTFGTDILNFAASADLRDRGRQVASVLQRSFARDPSSAELLFDSVTLGSGAAEVIGSMTLKATNAKGKHLAIELSDAVASTFSLAGSSFSINSTNRQDVFGQDVGPGSGNLNRIPNAALQLPDVDPLQWPTALRLGEVFAINRAFGAGDILFKHEVIGFGRGRNGVRYEVRLRDNETGRQYSILANTVVATSLGFPVVPFDDVATLANIARAWGSNTTSNNLAELRQITNQQIKDRAARDVPFATNQPVPGVITLTDFNRMAASSRYPGQPFVNRKVVIGGFGDSGKVNASYLSGLADSLGYGMSVAQLGRPETIYAVGEKAKDCIDYILNNRVRYALVAGAIKAGKIVPVNGKITQINNGITTVFTDTGTTEIAADINILTPGFRSTFGELLQDIRPGLARERAENDPQLELVEADVPGRGRRAVAKKVPGEEIYLAGAGANLPVGPDNIAGVSQNSVSIFITGPRTATFYANAISPLNGGFAPVGEARPPLVNLTNSSSPDSATFGRDVSQLLQFQNTRPLSEADQAKFMLAMLRFASLPGYRFAAVASGAPSTGNNPVVSFSFQLEGNSIRMRVLKAPGSVVAGEEWLARLDRETLQFMIQILKVRNNIQVEIPLVLVTQPGTPGQPSGGSRLQPDLDALRSRVWINF